MKFPSSREISMVFSTFFSKLLYSFDKIGVSQRVFISVKKAE